MPNYALFGLGIWRNQHKYERNEEKGSTLPPNFAGPATLSLFKHWMKCRCMIIHPDVRWMCVLLSVGRKNFHFPLAPHPSAHVYVQRKRAFSEIESREETKKGEWMPNSMSSDKVEWNRHDIASMPHGTIIFCLLGSSSYFLHSLHKNFGFEMKERKKERYWVGREGYNNNNNKSHCLQQTQNAIQKFFISTKVFFFQLFFYVSNVLAKKNFFVLYFFFFHLLTGNEHGLSKTTRSLST